MKCEGRLTTLRSTLDSQRRWVRHGKTVSTWMYVACVWQHLYEYYIWMLIFAVWWFQNVSTIFVKQNPLGSFGYMDYPTVFWQANRFALDDRSLSESLGSTGPGQYEADSDGIQMGFRWV